MNHVVFFFIIRVYPLNPRAKHPRPIFAQGCMTEHCKADSFVFEPCQILEILKRSTHSTKVNPAVLLIKISLLVIVLAPM